MVSGCASPKSLSSLQNTSALIDPAPAKIIIVRPEEKFVVVDFSLRTMPALGTKLTAYRAGRKIGTVQLNGPVLARTVAADVLDGEMQNGDEVR